VVFSKSDRSPGLSSDLLFAQSKPYTRCSTGRNLKAHYGLRIAVVSNESLVVNAHRIHKFKLDGFVDTFISFACPCRKPDVEIFGSRWISFRCQPAAYCTSKTHRCSSRSRKAWEFEAFFTRTTNPPEQTRFIRITEQQRRYPSARSAAVEKGELSHEN